MKKIGVYYGSTTGTTNDVAHRIGKKLGVDSADIKDISDFSSEEFKQYDVLVLGTSTWGDGDLQDDWYDALSDIKKMNLLGKQVALVGCGDSDSYDVTFCNGVGILHEELAATKCEFIGAISPDGYHFSDSCALLDGNLVGLLIDEDNESDQTSSRIDRWVDKLKSEL